jgi:hypothetical protein
LFLGNQFTSRKHWDWQVKSNNQINDPENHPGDIRRQPAIVSITATTASQCWLNWNSKMKVIFPILLPFLGVFSSAYRLINPVIQRICTSDGPQRSQRPQFSLFATSFQSSDDDLAKEYVKQRDQVTKLLIGSWLC